MSMLTSSFVAPDPWDTVWGSRTERFGVIFLRQCSNQISGLRRDCKNVALIVTHRASLIVVLQVAHADHRRDIITTAS